MGKTHYILMGGLHGCIPSHCQAHTCLANAVDEAVLIYELGKGRARTLYRDLYLELNPARDGNDYVEIVECNCDEPWVHSEDDIMPDRVAEWQDWMAAD